jgi:hypothetical protein
MRSRRPLVLTSLLAVAAFALLAAGCGGGGSPGAAGVTTSATAAQAGAQSTAIAFARCMRLHGLPNWPDPTSGGVFDKSRLRQSGYSVSQVRAVQDGACHRLLPSGPPPGPVITAADRTDYLKATACMRSHGYPDFPDPTFQNNTVQGNVSSSINQDSTRFKSAATICTKLIPAGLPYSGNRGP